MPVGWNWMNSMILQLRAGVVRQRVAVAGVFPAVARDLVGAAEAAGGHDDGLARWNTLKRPRSRS